MSQNYTDTNISNMILNDMTEAQFSNLANVDPDQLYLTEDISANQDLSNLSDTGKITNTNNCWPSTTVTSLTATGGGSYVAPANGWFIADAVSSTTNQSLVNLTGRLGTVCYGIGGAHVGVVCQAAKGETIRLWMSNVSSATLKFRYAQGSESEAS